MADIKRLLNKKGWTGRELGQLLLAEISYEYKQALGGNYAPEHLISDSQFTRMVRSISDRGQGKTYSDYYSIFEWLKTRPAITNGYLMNAQANFATLRGFIAESMFAEEVYQFVERLPAIMTQKQFDDLKAERIEARFKSEDGDELESNVFNLVERAIHFYLMKLQKEPKKPNPLKAIRKKYTSQPVRSKLILSRYNEVTDNGYFVLEDGRRSDQMTEAEWDEAITTPLMRSILAENGEDLNNRKVTQEAAMKYAVASSKLVYDEDTDIDRADEEAEYRIGLNFPVERKIYEEPPEDLTKWDIIEQELLLEFYPADVDGGGDEYSHSNFTASMQDFCTEFQELVTAMLADIDRVYLSTEKTKLTGLPVEEWDSTTVSWRRLYELDFYGEREEAESDTVLFSGNRRAILNGIAILRPSDILEASPWIDERGYYTEPDIDRSVRNHSLEVFFTDSENYARKIGEIEEATSELYENYYFLMGYNRQIDLVIEFTDVKELEIFKVDLKSLRTRISAFNDLVPILYRQIKGTDYKDKELQARKLEVLKDIFPPLDIDSMVIPEENIEQARELVENFTAFRGNTHMMFESLLCYRPKSDDGEGAC